MRMLAGLVTSLIVAVSTPVFGQAPAPAPKRTVGLTYGDAPECTSVWYMQEVITNAEASRLLKRPAEACAVEHVYVYATCRASNRWWVMCHREATLPEHTKR